MKETLTFSQWIEKLDEEQMQATKEHIAKRIEILDSPELRKVEDKKYIERLRNTVARYEAIEYTQ